MKKNIKIGITKTKVRYRPKNKPTYEERFLKEYTMHGRGDKAIYVRSEYHQKLLRIVQVIAQSRIPLYAYLDNILKHHLDLFEQEITEDFNNKNNPIF